jgi:hypothetical protein
VSIRLKGGFTTTDRRLDRLVHFDERSRNFPIRTLIPATLKPRGYTWSCATVLDQQSEGACTGFSVAHEAIARPVLVKNVTNQTALDIYRRAKQLDEWPGEDYEGSSVIAAIKAGREKKWYGEFRWAFGLDDLILAVGHKGPAVLGINWYNGMFDADAKGFVSPTGSLAGGHAILVNGVNVKEQFFRLHNSWGPSWGMNGECFITFNDLGQLLKEDGEACIPVQRSLG